MADKTSKLSFGLPSDYIKIIDWQRAKHRIEHDVRSDFIIAPHYNHIFTRAFDQLKTIVAKELMSGRFSPTLPLTIDVPKTQRMRVRPFGRAEGPNFSRPGSILAPKDRLLYQILADEAAPFIDGQMDRTRSYSHWLKSPDAEEMFIPTRVCWNEMQSALRKLSRRSRFEYIVKMDISDCFGSVNLHTLINSLDDVGYSAALRNALGVQLKVASGLMDKRAVGDRIIECKRLFQM
jgi:hypothetical protein